MRQLREIKIPLYILHAHYMFCLQRYISLLFLVHYLLHIYSIYWNQFSHNLLLRGSTIVTRFNRNSDNKFVYVLVSIVTVFPGVKKVLFVLKYRKCLKSDSQKNLETQSYWKRNFLEFNPERMLFPFIIGFHFSL